MTRGTPGRRPAFTVVVGAVVEFHIKAFPKLGREGLHWRRVRLKVTVTDRAHDLITIHQRAVGELIQMTADAGIMAGKVHVQRTPLTTVAGCASELLVFRDGVRKGLKGLVGCLLNERIGRFGGGQRNGRLRRLIQTTRRRRDDRAENKEGFQQVF